MSTPLGGGEVEFEPTEGATHRGLRDTIEAVLNRKDAPAGVFIPIDEVHNADPDQLAMFGNAIQHLKRQDRPVSAVVAGLPPEVDDDLATFLGRCTKPDLEALSADVVRVGLQRTAPVEGGRFSGAALDLAVAVAAGHPFIVQLVGYWSWDRSGDGRIDLPHVSGALERCEQELSKSLLQLRQPLMPVERTYLGAMAVDDGPSSTSEVARRMGRTDRSAGTYRRRLLDKPIIVEAGTGKVDFAVPGYRRASAPKSRSRTTANRRAMRFFRTPTTECAPAQRAERRGSDPTDARSVAGSVDDLLTVVETSPEAAIVDEQHLAGVVMPHRAAARRRPLEVRGTSTRNHLGHSPTPTAGTLRRPTSSAQVRL